MNKMNRFLSLLFAAALLLSLASCGKPADDETTTGFSNGFFRLMDNTLQFVDENTGGFGYEGVVLCTQPGCKHTDSSCPAWVSDCRGYQIVAGTFYIAEVTDEGARLIEKALPTLDTRVIASWDNVHGDDQSVYYQVGNLHVSNGFAILREEKTIEQKQDFEWTEENETIYWRIDLATGEKTVLFEGENPDRITVDNFYGNHAIVIYWEVTPVQDIMSEEEFLSTYGENASYNRYRRRQDLYELRLYDLDSGDYTVLAPLGEYVVRTDGQANNGNQTLYQIGDEMYVFDMETLESKLLFTRETIINYWILDNKAFVIALDGLYFDLSARSRFYYIPLDGGDLVPFEEDNPGPNIRFSMGAETENCFLGYCDGPNGPGTYWIKKEDFYAGRYDKMY